MQTQGVLDKYMGDSALVFALNVWVNEPHMRDPVIDRLNTKIYKALNEASIEIPFPKTDVYLYPQGNPSE